MSNTLIRPARPEDAGEIVRLVRALAVYENEPVETVKMTEVDVLRDGFSEPRRFEVLLAEHEGEAVGFALYFHNYSTWEGRAGIYIEDLFLGVGALGGGRSRRDLGLAGEESRRNADESVPDPHVGSHPIGLELELGFESW